MFFNKSAVATASQTYKISRSLRFRSSATAYLNRTPGVAGNQQTWTWSGWVKRGSLGSSQQIFAADNASTLQSRLHFTATDTLEFISYNAAFQLQLITTQVFRDPSAWYHIVLTMDTTQATASNRSKIYINGNQVTAFGTATYPTQNYNGIVNQVLTHFHGKYFAGEYLDGYLAEVNFVDGQALTPSSFGAFNQDNTWRPIKYTGTYGTNGFYLNFSDNSAVTAAAIGKDYSGNGNNWTPTNISVTAGVTYDSTLDVPTSYGDNGNGRGNYPVWNALKKHDANFSITNANLTASDSSGSAALCTATMRLPTTGKWYWEVTATTISGILGYVGVNTEANADGTVVVGNVGSYRSNGSIFDLTTAAATSGATYASGDVIGVAVDVSSGTCQFYKNGVAQGTTPSFNFTAGTILVPFIGSDNSAGTKTFDANFGQRPFSYTVPSGYLTLNTANLPVSDVNRGSEHFAATTYVATGSALTISNAINGLSFKPDFLWIKNRTSGSLWHNLFDSVRGVTVRLSTNSTTSAAVVTNGLSSFNSNGFTLGTDSALSGINVSAADNIVAWQWKAGGTAVTNTNGSITSQVSANPTAGFSIVSYTATGANATVGHGLGVAPKMIIVKNTASGTTNWPVYHESLTAAGEVFLNATNAYAADANMWQGASPTSTVFSVGTNANLVAGVTIAYCWAEVPGYSKFDYYTGNGAADGPFVYCGFRPRWIMIKRSSGIANWFICDTSRDTHNVSQNRLYPSAALAEATSPVEYDILSNGFKIRVDGATDVGTNGSGDTYIYAAFAEVPFKNANAR